jgi:hypothetical protein
VKRISYVLLVLVASGCDDEPTTSQSVDGGAGFSADPSVIADLAGGTCGVMVAAPPDEGAAHAEACSTLTPGSRPPSSGKHYPSWPVFRVYDKPVPWGFLLHGMEHGAVVIAHNCTVAPDCATQIAAVKEMVAALPTKAGCPRPPVIVTPDPTLDVPFAAAAWGYTLRASCFDRERFKAFVDRRANMGREFSPVDCGFTDLEAQGWCK